MSVVAGIREGLLEGRSLWGELRRDPPAHVGSVAVSGMLAEQLARELGAGAAPGAVSVREGAGVVGAEVVVRVIAGDPSPEDSELVRGAELADVPVVLVQLWPQAEWTQPFVLTPFVVECRAGEGFPVREIADRITEATERAPALAARIPVLQDAVGERVRRSVVVRSALLGLLGSRGGSRPLLALEQARAISRLRASGSRESAAPDPRAAAGLAALVLASGFAFRAAARATRGRLPARIVDAVVAAGGTWALTEAARQLEDRFGRASRPCVRPDLDLACGASDLMGGTMPDTELAEELLQL